MERNTNADTQHTPTRERAARKRTITLIRTKSRIASVIRIISVILAVLSILAHGLIYVSLSEFARPSALATSTAVTLIATLIISLLFAWFINILAEPFEQLRNCSDSLINIENMMAHQLEESGTITEEEFL